MNRRIILFIWALIRYSGTFSQTCSGADELRNQPGQILEAQISQLNELPAKHRLAAINTVKSLEQHFKKNLRFTGGASEVLAFQPASKSYFGGVFHQTYSLRMTFFEWLCNQGTVLRNPGSPFMLTITANAPYENVLYLDFTSAGRQSILYYNFCHWLRIPRQQADKINSGNGFHEYTYHNPEKEHATIFREWYITQPAIPLVVPVSRKEYLNGLLEFYRQRKQYFISGYQEQVKGCDQFLHKRARVNEDAAFQEKQEEKKAALQAIRRIEYLYQKLKAPVEHALHNQPDVWLRKQAFLNPRKDFGVDIYTDNTLNFELSFVFNGFYEEPDATGIFQWNRALFSRHADQPAKPLFFKLSFRYEAENPFASQLLQQISASLNFRTFQQFLR